MQLSFTFVLRFGRHAGRGPCTDLGICGAGHQFHNNGRGIDPKENVVTVQKKNGERVIYYPSRLRGISAYREIEREFALGDLIQLTAPNRSLVVTNRNLGTPTIAEDESDRCPSAE
jgi:hypothetical protein